MLSTHPTSIELDVFFFAVFIIQLFFYFVNTFLQFFQIIFAVFYLQHYFVNKMAIPLPGIAKKSTYLIFESNPLIALHVSLKLISFAYEN